MFRLNDTISNKLQELKMSSYSIKDETKYINIEDNSFLLQEDFLLIED